jgi:CRISPR-associated protein Cmr3
MRKYIVKLTPTGRFFFGGDMTFTIGKKDKRKGDKDQKETVYHEHNDKFSSYIITSMKFPQQTSLLGMMRFLLLSDSDNKAFDNKTQKISDSKKAIELIGKKSFSVNDGNSENVFGKIKNIGACFLCKDNKYYYQAPFDYNLKIGALEEDVTAKLNGKPINIPEITISEKEFRSKDGIEKCYVASDGDTLKDDAIFIKDSRIGIRKGTNGKTEDEAFYKQIAYRLNNGFCFAFNAEVADDIILTKYNKQLVSVGADGSMFIIEIEEGSIDVNLPELYTKRTSASLGKVNILSDAYIPETDLIKYAISETKSFRFLNTTVETENYNIMHNFNNRSKHYSLYAAGSVFFVNDVEKFKEIIKGKKEFVQIGYNYCK